MEDMTMELALARIEALERQLETDARAHREALADQALAQTVASSGARDPELVEYLLRKAGAVPEDGNCLALESELAAIRKERPWLFTDQGDRPRFSAGTMARALDREDPAVAERYRGNPFYRKK